MKKKVLLALAAALCLTAQGGAFAEKYEAMPEIFRFRQSTATETTRNTRIRRTYPDCANDAVDEEMRRLVDDMSARAVEEMGNQKPSLIDTGASVFRTGESAMSFLTLSYAQKDDKQVYMSFDARVYDLSDGKRLALADLIEKDGAAWQTLASAVRDAVNAYFPNDAPDATALDAACAREALENAAFTLTPARLVLHYRADSFYPGKHTLIHVALAHDLWRDSMTESAARQTDCSRFKLIALTYDDGPAHGNTNRVMDVLREFGANATFFGIGSAYNRCADLLCRQHDALFAVESHSFQHEHRISASVAVEWAAKVDSRMKAIIGVGPSMMRAPGGDPSLYLRGGVMLPFIGWNLRSDDLGSEDADKVTRRILGLAEDGKVVLMHDICPFAPTYSRDVLTALEERGYLCVTVAELYAIYDIPLVPNSEYNGTETTDAASAIQ